MRTRKNNAIGVVSALVALGVASFATAGDKAASLHAGLNLTDGNSENLTFNVGAAAAVGNPEEDEVFSTYGIDYNYGENASSTTVENVTAAADLRRILSGDTYGYLSGSLLNDDIANIDLRVILGPGLGHYFIRNDQTLLNGEIGVSWIYEDQGGLDDNIAALRIAQGLEHQLSDTARLFESVEYLPELNDFDNYLLNAEVGIEADLNENLALRLVIKDRYDATPAAGSDDNDIELIGGLSYAL